MKVLKLSIMIAVQLCILALLIIQFETMAIGSQHFSVKAKLDDYSQEFVEYVGFDYIDQDLLDKDIAFGERLYVILRPNEDGIAEIDGISDRGRLFQKKDEIVLPVHLGELEKAQERYTVYQFLPYLEVDDLGDLADGIDGEFVITFAVGPLEQFKVIDIK